MTRKGSGPLRLSRSLPGGDVVDGKWRVLRQTNVPARDRPQLSNGRRGSAMRQC